MKKTLTDGNCTLLSFGNKKDELLLNIEVYRSLDVECMKKILVEIVIGMDMKICTFVNIKEYLECSCQSVFHYSDIEKCFKSNQDVTLVALYYIRFFYFFRSYHKQKPIF